MARRRRKTVAKNKPQAVANHVIVKATANTKKTKTELKMAAKGANVDNDSKVPAAKQPPKFSWIEAGLLAAHGRPTQDGHLQFLCENGVKYVVTLTLNKPRALVEYTGNGFEWVHIPIQDETPPSVEQVKQLMALVDKAKLEKTAVSVHCAWGRGRTGTMMACYLLKSKRLTTGDAIDEIRRLRPGSVDNDKQVNAIEQYADYLSKNPPSE